MITNSPPLPPLREDYALWHIFLAYVFTAALTPLGVLLMSGSLFARFDAGSLMFMMLIATFTGVFVAFIGAIPTVLVWMLVRRFAGESLITCLLFGIFVSVCLITIIAPGFSIESLGRSLPFGFLGALGGLIYWALGPRSRKGDSHDWNA